MIKIRHVSMLIAVAVICASLSACAKKEPVVDSQIEPVKIAVVSSFLPTAKLLANEFTTNTGIAVEFTNGSDEELVAMILEGGEYDIYMASDVEHPKALVDKTKAQGEGALVYAYGIPALYCKEWKVNWTAPQYLSSGQFATLGVANPEDNRYGRAGVALLKNIDVYDNLESKIVYTDNEQVTLDQIKSRQIDAGFVAYSSLTDRSKRWAWIVPAKLYDPIEQGAVLITKDNINDSAKIWMGYLNSDSAKSIIQQSGYGVYGIHEDTAVSSSD